MGKVAKIARRTFLLGSATIAGGVAFGVYLYNKPLANPLLADLEPGEATFNPWVRINAEGITLIAPHADLGQGVRSLQAMLIAEEMDLDAGQFSVEAGVPAAAYYNTAMGAESLPFDRDDDSVQARATRTIFDTMARNLPLQGTGGSTTAADTFVKLREAGAVARETLKLAASRREEVPVSRLNTRSAAVILPDGREIPYTELAADAADVDPVTNVTLRDPSEWRLVGREFERLDILGKSTGTLEYGIDLKHEGMVHAAVKLNPHQGGPIGAYDARTAMGMQGMRRVMKIEGGIAAVADNSWTAMQAAQAVECEWGEADFLPNMDDHWSAISNAFSSGPVAAEARNDGDVESALGNNVLEGEYRAPYVAHAPLEPIGALILVTDERADIWVGTQIPGFAQAFVADITGHTLEDVYVHDQYMGGSFGHRLEFENIKHAAEIGNAMRGTTVKLTYSREEDMTHDFPRHISMSRFRAAGANGRIEALDIAVAGASPVSSQSIRSGIPRLGADTQLYAGIANAPYAIPNMRVRSYEVDNLAPVSSWRSVGASVNGFFVECAMDEAILAAGGDPMEERLRLCDDPHSKAVLEAVAEMSNWGSDLGENRGRGVAFVESFGTPTAEVIEVTNTEQGIRIDKVHVAANVGPVLDPINFDNCVKGGVVWGLGHAMNCEITYSDGVAEQSNFDAHEGMRMHQCPEIVVRAVDTGKHITGIGEPPVPPAPPALANAIFAATGTRIREMPFNKFVDFA